MAGQKGNKGHANKTSYPNQQNNFQPDEVIIEKFCVMLDNAIKDDNILCFWDACQSVGWLASTVAYYVKRTPILEGLKKDIQLAIDSRINKEALTGNFNATAAIWRSKMLGNSETQNIDVKSGGDKLKSEPPVIKIIK